MSQLVLRGKKINNFGKLEYNKIYFAFELIGLYDLFKGSDYEFPEYYKSQMEEGIRRYYFRNRGVNIIHDLLCLDLEPNNELGFYISKRSMRRTGISKYTVISYQGTEVFVDRILKYFEENQFLGEFYFNHIHNPNINKYLLFQDDYIKEYITTHHGERAEVFNDMREAIEERINE